jgi:hypothetical protein
MNKKPVESEKPVDHEKPGKTFGGSSILDENSKILEIGVILN